MCWTQLSHLRGTGLTHSWSTKTLSVTWLLVLEGLLQRWVVAVAHCRDKDTGSRNSGKYSLAWDPLESSIRPTTEPVAPYSIFEKIIFQNKKGLPNFHKSENIWCCTSKLLMMLMHQSAGNTVQPLSWAELPMRWWWKRRSSLRGKLGQQRMMDTGVPSREALAPVRWVY